MSVHDASNSKASSSGIVLVGLDRAEVFEGIVREHPPQPNGYSAPIYLVEPDRTRGEAFAQSHGVDSDTRFRCFFGDLAEQELVRWLTDRLDGIALPRTIELSGVHHANLARSIAAQVERLVSAQDEQTRASRSNLEARLRERGPDGWSERFGAIRSGAAARVLITTTRYSTYIQHACEDLADSLRGMGHEALVLREPDTHSAMTPLRCLRAQEDFDPDLCVVVNYPRVMHDTQFPAGVPHVCWVQDAMAHLFAPLPTKPVPSDFIAGHIYADAPGVQAFEGTNRLEFPVPVSTRKFHPAPVSDELHERYACDLAYISHQSEPADRFHERFVSRFPSDLHAHFEALRRRVVSIAERWDSILANKELRALRHEAGAGLGRGDPDQVGGVLWSQYLHPMLERLLRHQMLEWAGEIADRRGLDFRLYGRGWDTHPTLSRFARGALAHGEALRAAYQCARVQLHASSLGCGHQRLGECVCSGGLLLSRRSWDEFLRENLYRARLNLQGGAEPDACLVEWRQPCFTLRNHPELRAIIDERARIPRPDLGWDHEPLGDEVYAEIEGHPWVRYISDPVPPETQRPLTLLDRPYEMTFSTREELENGVLRASHDDAWRRERSAEIRARVSGRVSMDRFAASMLEMVCDRLCAQHDPMHAGVGA